MRKLLATTAATLIIAIALTGGAAAAQTTDGLRAAPGDELRIVAVDTSNFPDVAAIVALPQRARGQSGPAAGLSVTSGGVAVPASVESLSADRQSVAILLDTAEGTDQATLTAQQGAAAEFVRGLDPTTPIVIGTSAAGVMFGPRNDRDGALAVLAQLKLGGVRNWPVTLNATLDAVAGTPLAAVVVVSTGKSIEIAPMGVSRRLLIDGLKLNWISLRSDAGPSGELEGIQSVTSAPNSGLLVRLDSIAADLVAQYRLRFRVDPRATAASFSLTASGQTWEASTPLPVPGAVYVEPPPRVSVAAPEVTAARDVTSAPSVVQRTSSFARTNWPFLLAVAVALALMGAALFAVSVPAPQIDLTREESR